MWSCCCTPNGKEEKQHSTHTSAASLSSQVLHLDRVWDPLCPLIARLEGARLIQWLQLKLPWMFLCKSKKVIKMTTDLCLELFIFLFRSIWLILRTGWTELVEKTWPWMEVCSCFFCFSAISLNFLSGLARYLRSVHVWVSFEISTILFKCLSLTFSDISSVPFCAGIFWKIF